MLFNNRLANIVIMYNKKRNFHLFCFI